MESKKIIIFYYSYSTMSTQKLVQGIQAAFPNIEILLLPSDEKNDVSSYDYVGFASGIYAWDFGKPIIQKIEKLTGLEGKKYFSLCSSGAGSEKYIYYPKRGNRKERRKILERIWMSRKSQFFPFEYVWRSSWE